MTDTHHVQITLDGTRGELKIGDRDLTHALSGFTLKACGGEMPELEVDLLVLTGDVTSDERARVVIPAATHEALIALGWTPPTSD